MHLTISFYFTLFVFFLRSFFFSVYRVASTLHSRFSDNKRLNTIIKKRRTEQKKKTKSQCKSQMKLKRNMNTSMPDLQKSESNSFHLFGCTHFTSCWNIVLTDRCRIINYHQTFSNSTTKTISQIKRRKMPIMKKKRVKK